MEFARFGRLMISRSRATRKQFEAAQAQMVARYPITVGEIDDLVASIAAQIARLPPGRLLQRGWWEYSAMVVGLGGRDAGDSEKLAAARMVDYVQSVIVSVKPERCVADVGEADWAKLKADVETLFRRLTLDYQTCLTAHRRAQDPELDMQLEEFRFRAETHWLNIRGKRYQRHEREALLDVLTPHSDILMKLFGLNAAELAAEFDKILTRLTHGLMEIARETKELQAKSMARLDELAAKREDLDFDAQMAKVFEDPDLAAQRVKLAGALVGLDLFDVSKNTVLPKSMLDALSYSPGENTDFFALGEFAGWPLRIWPTMRRPFIRLNGSTYCFDLFSLFDNIYRVLRRIVVELEPAYEGSWNDRQKAISEELPFTYLTRLMPGARVYRPVYYR
jgi:preprotein translocase subunit SecA